MADITCKTIADYRAYGAGFLMDEEIRAGGVLLLDKDYFCKNTENDRELHLFFQGDRTLSLSHGDANLLDGRQMETKLGVLTEFDLFKNNHQLKLVLARQPIIVTRNLERAFEVDFIGKRGLAYYFRGYPLSQDSQFFPYIRLLHAGVIEGDEKKGALIFQTEWAGSIPRSSLDVGSFAEATLIPMADWELRSSIQFYLDGPIPYIDKPISWSLYDHFQGEGPIGERSTIENIFGVGLAVKK